MREKRAFTLTELIAVITIIGIVILVVVPAVIKVLNNQKEEKCTTYVSIVEKAIKAYSDILPTTTSAPVSVQTLIDGQYLEDFQNGNGIRKGYTPDTVLFTIKKINGKVTIAEPVQLLFEYDGESHTCGVDSCS